MRSFIAAVALAALSPLSLAAETLEEVTAEDVRRHFESNTLSTFLCSQHAGFHLTLALINRGSLQWQDRLTPLQQRMEESVAALSEDYEIVRYAWRGNRWAPSGGAIPDAFSLDCRVVTPSFGPIYRDLPELRNPDDRWLVAFPRDAMAVVSDLRDRADENGAFRVVLRRTGRGLTASFEDQDGLSLTDPIAIGR